MAEVMFKLVLYLLAVNNTLGSEHYNYLNK